MAALRAKSSLVLLAGVFWLISLGTAQAVTEFQLPPGPESLPTSIVEGPDGNLWITQSGRGSIVRLTPSGVLTEFRIPNGVSPNAITVGPDGAMWFTDLGSSQIGRISVQGTITLFPLAGTYGIDIVTGSDGNLWFTEATPFPLNSLHEDNKRNPTESARRAAHPACAMQNPRLSAPPAGQYLARMTTHGAVTEFGPFGGSLISMTNGPDGNLWLISSNSTAGNVQDQHGRSHSGHFPGQSGFAFHHPRPR